MKKIFLLLSIGCNIFCMDSAPDTHQEISKNAASLHRFLTQHLDDELEDPDYKAVNELADRLNELSLNSSVLLELKDKRSHKPYNFGSYLSRQNNKKSRLEVTLNHIAPLVPRSVSFSNQTQTVCQPQKEETVAAISVNNPVEGCLVTDKQVKAFALIRNGDKKYQPDSDEYSLVHLLIACKRPDVLLTLLDRSKFIPRFPNAAQLKKYCDDNDADNDNENNKWGELAGRIDDAVELSAATDFVLKAKTTALHNVPAVAFIAVGRDTIEGDLRALMHAEWVRYDHIESIYIRTPVSKPDHRINPMNYVLGWALMRMFKQIIWVPLVDKTEELLDIDERSTALLTRKPIANAVIGTSKACQAVTPECVKARLRNNAESEKSEADSNN